MSNKLVLSLLMCLSIVVSSCKKEEKAKEEIVEKPIIKKVTLDGSWYWLGVPAKSKEKKLPVIVALRGDEGQQ